MAHIRARGPSFTAEVYVGGERRTRSFRSKLDAILWAKKQESEAPERTSYQRNGLRLPTYPVNGPPGPEPPIRVVDGMPKALRTLSATRILQRPRFKASCGIYFLIRGDEIVYVGQSKNVHGRAANHVSSCKEFDSYTYIECDPEDLDELERYYIRTLLPPLNYSSVPEEERWRRFARSEEDGEPK